MKVFVAVLLNIYCGFRLQKTHLATSLLLHKKDNHITPFEIVNYKPEDEYVLKIECNSELLCPPALNKEVKGNAEKVNDYLKSQVLILSVQKDQEGWVKIQIKNKKTNEEKEIEQKFFITQEIKVQKVSNSEIFGLKLPIKLWKVLPPFDNTPLDIHLEHEVEGFKIQKFGEYIELHGKTPPQNLKIILNLYDPISQLKSAEMKYMFSKNWALKRKILAIICAFLIVALTIGLVLVIIYFSGVSSTLQNKSQELQEQKVPDRTLMSPSNHVILPIERSQKEVHKDDIHEIRYR